QFGVAEETIAVPNFSPALNGLRVVTIADIHTGSNYAPPERVGLVVEQATAQQADVLGLLGDYVSESKFDRERRRILPEGEDWTDLKVPAEVIAESLKGLRARYGVFAIIGNHDWYHNEPKIHRLFESISGINVLQNEIAEIDINGERLRIWGI